MKAGVSVLRGCCLRAPRQVACRPRPWFLRALEGGRPPRRPWDRRCAEGLLPASRMASLPLSSQGRSVGELPGASARGSAQTLPHPPPPTIILGSGCAWEVGRTHSSRHPHMHGTRQQLRRPGPPEPAACLPEEVRLGLRRWPVLQNPPGRPVGSGHPAGRQPGLGSPLEGRNWKKAGDRCRASPQPPGQVALGLKARE